MTHGTSEAGLKYGHALNPPSIRRYACLRAVAVAG